MGKKIAIYGAGTIGACQATLTSGNGYSTVVIGHSEEGLSRCRNTMLQNWNDLIAQKLATAANRRAAMDLVTITNDVSALRDCDIVFEAVSEDVNIKQRVYSIITEVCGRDIIPDVFIQVIIIPYGLCGICRFIDSLMNQIIAYGDKMNGIIFQFLLFLQRSFLRLFYLFPEFGLLGGGPLMIVMECDE